MARDKDYIKLIHAARWVKLRHDKLSRNPICERCEEEGRITPATEVHHITPVEIGVTRQDKERLVYDWHNLRSLCHECHVKTHTEMGRSGKELTKNRAREHLRRFVEKFM